MSSYSLVSSSTVPKLTSTGKYSGTLSISQLILDAYLSDDWSGISGDPVKFGLGFVSIAFDLVFMTQHYILYRDRTDIYYGESTGDTKSQDSQHLAQLEEQQSLLGHSSISRYTNARDKGDLEQDAIEEAKKVRQEEWEKAYKDQDSKAFGNHAPRLDFIRQKYPPPPPPEEELYDPRTLYERLQEQKQKKQDAFLEATKFGNLIHKIDNDEFDFLNSLESEEVNKKKAIADQEEEELKRFRVNVKIKSAPPPPTDPTELPTLPFAPTPILSGSSKKKLSVFSGLVKKKGIINSTTETKTTTVIGVESNSSKGMITAGKRKGTGRSDTEQSSTPDKADDSPDSKKIKTDKDSSSKPNTAPAKKNGLAALVAYDSSDDEDD
ncbi:hypothetical protein BGW38_010165 [Lunasporangiospora selenospora]|uniref:FAM192A/Fyv6 N-terminal domain-containing protein n=1 Tax=Lunasporangiospora selenospora TaxID=979761 RepID=A0A9P6G5J1_9FUNG|nr:hypothetical protein BGW38_010165 [Lunasporangiospora selenospora]